MVTLHFFEPLFGGLGRNVRCSS